LDTACERTVAGTAWLEEHREQLQQTFCLTSVVMPEHEVYKFGNTTPQVSSQRWLIPCAIAGRCLEIRASAVGGDFPPLRSLRLMASLGIVINTVTRSVSIHAFVRNLSFAGASAEALVCAKALRCPVCDRHNRQMQSRRPAKVTAALTFNDHVYVDVFHIVDSGRAFYPCVAILDEATSFTRSRSVGRAFQRSLSRPLRGGSQREDGEGPQAAECVGRLRDVRSLEHTSPALERFGLPLPSPPSAAAEILLQGSLGQARRHMTKWSFLTTPATPSELVPRKDCPSTAAPGRSPYNPTRRPASGEPPRPENGFHMIPRKSGAARSIRTTRSAHDRETDVI
jgi:hypothetical protein